mgnify:CR=1 FL=1
MDAEGTEVEWLMIDDYWLLIIRKLIKLRKFFTHCLSKEEFIKLRKFFATCLLIVVLIKLRKCLMTDDLMDYILSGYKLYENKGETWKYGQVLTKIQNIIVSLQRICDDFG